MKTIDVIIIGAGASGATAAYHLARAGKKVLILEKNEVDNLKPCAGGMAASVKKFFPFQIESIVDQIIEEVNFSFCLEDPIRAKLPGSSPFWIIRREKLDSLIINHAIDKGAEVIRPFKVSDIRRKGAHWEVISEDSQKIKSRGIVIADGSNSPWAKKLSIGPKKIHQASTISVRLKGRGNLKDGTTRFEFGLVKHGFAWAFPLKDGVNVGVGTFIGQPATYKNKNVLEEFLPSLGFNSEAGKRITASLRVWNGHHNLHGEGVVLVGDAASLCDPFLAEGLRPAIMSGFEAAISLENWLNGSTNNLGDYTKRIKVQWGESMAWGRRIAQVFYRFPKVGYQLGIKRPTAPQRIAEILSGDMGYGDIAERVIKRLLFNKSK